MAMLQSRPMNNLSHFSDQPRSATDTSAITALCKAAGDPLRMQVLKVLQQNAYGVLELCQVLDIRQSAMSHHLKILANAGLVATRREGTTIFYRRNLFILLCSNKKRTASNKFITLSNDYTHGKFHVLFKLSLHILWNELCCEWSRGHSVRSYCYI